MTRPMSKDKETAWDSQAKKLVADSHAAYGLMLAGVSDDVCDT